MTHDHLCPQPVRELSRPGLTVIAGTCHCATIAKVREDMLTKCIEAVESLTFFSGDDKEQALASMRALEGKP